MNFFQVDIFNKCHNKAVFMKTIEFGYIIYKCDGGYIFCTHSRVGLVFSCARRESYILFASHHD